MPVADKLANQRHLAAIRDGMVVAIPLSILGGACLIVSTPPFKPETLPNWVSSLPCLQDGTTELELIKLHYYYHII